MTERKIGRRRCGACQLDCCANRTVERAALKTMGVDESMKGKIFAEFDRIPGAYPITVELTAEEYSSFEVNAKAAGKSASKFAKERLLKPNVQ